VTVLIILWNKKQGVNVKGLYLLLYSIEHTTISLSILYV